ncbi:hypothetical protein F5148DRAFT_1289433 [Russula earlei]|uniref:Uncharacterized protein n=1 Tax=Russula earlei TaxID=71964 RepID=A0ACC0TZJ0_9AGAM|nr:hypothetical protein F5148DRAFT_1289433 [Russula earlei]
MKKYSAIIIVLVSFINVLHTQTLSTAITFEERVHEFGTILEKNGKVSHAFVFHNNGKAPVTINDIRSDCGCIGKVIANPTVKPGGKGTVIITFNPQYKSGFFSKEIMIYSNDGKEFNHVWVEGTVTPMEHPVEDDYPYNFGNGLYLRLKVMAFGYEKPGETKQVELHYANNTNKPMKLSFLAEGGKNELKYNTPDQLKPKERGVMVFSFTMPPSFTEDVMIHLHPLVNGKKIKETLDAKILNWNKKFNNSPKPK